MTYQVIDRETRTVKGTYASLDKARSRANKLDLAHGAIRYVVRRVE